MLGIHPPEDPKGFSIKIGRSREGFSQVRFSYSCPSNPGLNQDHRVGFSHGVVHIQPQAPVVAIHPPRFARYGKNVF